MESMTIEAGGQTFVKNVFDGTTGYAMQMGNKKEMDAADIADKKGTNGLFKQLSYATNGTKLEFAGMDKVGGSDAYKLTVTSPSGKTRTEYYDIKSGLLVKDEENIKAGGQDIAKSTEYKYYKKFGNVLFPQTIAQSLQSPMGAQEFSVVIKDTKVNEGVTAEDFK